MINLLFLAPVSKAQQDHAPIRAPATAVLPWEKQPRTVLLSLAPPALILCAAFLTPACFGQQRTRLANQEAPLADARYGPGTVALVVSQDGSRGVSVFRDGSSLAVIDGCPGFFYDELATGMPLLTDDGAHCAYVGRRSAFSLFGHLSNWWFVVFDGAESIPFVWVNGESPVFSPAGTRLAAITGDSDGKEVVCVFTAPPPPRVSPAAAPTTVPVRFPVGLAETTKPEGPLPKLASVAGPTFDQIAAGSVRFSPDGKHLAYAARRGTKWHIVLDGIAGGAYDVVGRPQFCSSGALLGYVASREGKSVVVDVPIGVAGAVGAESRPHNAILQDSLAFSFDGRHQAYAAGITGKMSVFLDGSEVTPAAPLHPLRAGPPPTPRHPASIAAAPVALEQVASGSLTFSPDGSHFAFTALRGGEWFVVLDGAEGPHCLGIAAMPPVFSLNGKRLAYVAEALAPDPGKKWVHTAYCVVVDGVEQSFYDRIVSPPAFSPDGHRCAYVARRGAMSFVVIDGMEGKPYACVRGRPLLSIDGSHCAVTALADDPDGRFSAIEEVPRNPSDPTAGARLIFDRSPDFAWLTAQQQMNPVKLLLVEERVVSE